MTRRARNMITTNLKCDCCNNIFNIPRRRGETRSRGHVKHIWCFKCKDTTAHRDFHNDYDVIGEFATMSQVETNSLQTTQSMI